VEGFTGFEVQQVARTLTNEIGWRGVKIVELSVAFKRLVSTPPFITAGHAARRAIVAS
jgi:hypothetical protein